MIPPRLLLYGERGLIAETSVELAVGERAVVGRSRFTTISAATTPVARRIGRARLEASAAFRRLSRRHLEIAFESETVVSVVDHSSNGATCDGVRIPGSVRLDAAELARRPARLRFGAGEEILLSVVVEGASIAPRG